MQKSLAKDRSPESGSSRRADVAAFEALDDTCVLDESRFKLTGYFKRRGEIRSDIARTYWWLAMALYAAIIAFALFSLL